MNIDKMTIRSNGRIQTLTNLFVYFPEMNVVFFWKEKYKMKSLMVKPGIVDRSDSFIKIEGAEVR